MSVMYGSPNRWCCSKTVNATSLMWTAIAGARN